MPAPTERNHPVGAAAIAPLAAARLVHRRELRAGRIALAAWTLALSALVFFYMWVFKALVLPQAGAIQGLMNALPRQLLAAANFSALPFTDPLGFLGSEPYTLISLFSSIFIAQAAANALAKEETDGTAEFLLAKPIGRGGVVFGKAAAVITNLLVLDVALTFSMLVAFALFIDATYSSALVRLGLGLALLHLTYASIALWISASLRSSRAAAGLALGAVIAGYFLKVLGLISNRLAWLGDLSPFTHADSARIINQGGPSAQDAAVLLGIALAGLALAYWQFRRKDIQV